MNVFITSPDIIDFSITGDRNRKHKSYFEREVAKRYICYMKKECLLSFLTNDIIWNRAQLLCKIFRQKFVFAW